MAEPALYIVDTVALETATNPGPDTGTTCMRREDVSAPVFRATDRGFQRGDGIFETLSVIGGRPLALEAHLRRFASSARALRLPEPSISGWRQLVLFAIRQNPSEHEQYVKFMMSRGQESIDHPATVDPSSPPSAVLYIADAANYDDVRREGVSAILIESGRHSTLAARAPWLLLGAKSLSYAVNVAIQRAANDRGANDAIMVTTDGFVLESPSSTVIARIDGIFCSPDPRIGTLPGTAQSIIFAELARTGEKTALRDIRIDELWGAEALWLVSSVRMAVNVTSLDGKAVPRDAGHTAMLNDMLLSSGSAATSAGSE